ncbi:MAG: FAD-binding oxidoreductase [Bacteriovoracaceae bacterium]|nr:FAD-binding oxidoreductase [Bacteriovoracaceae bacterium]
MAAKNVSLPLKIALVGQGLSAEVFLYYFLKDLQATSLEITQFYAEDFAPACSLKSTAMAHTQGIQYGISPLGDLLLKAFEETVTFCDLEKPLGVEHIPYYFSAHPTQNSNLIKRFSHLQKKEHLSFFPLSTNIFTEDALQFSPPIFLSWLRDKNKSFKNYKTEHRFIRSYQDLKGFDAVVWCTGAYNNIFSPLEKKEGQVVAGSYLQFTNVLWEQSSFGLTWIGEHKKTQLVYHKKQGILLLGNTSIPSALFMSSADLLKKQYDEMTSLLTLPLPHFNEASFYTGQRYKLSKRKPYWGKVLHLPQHYSIFGLYKNGYTFSFLAAKELSKELKNDLSL